MQPGVEGFNATNPTTHIRKRWIALFADYRVRIEIMYLEPAFRMVLEQNPQREKPVPVQLMRELLERVESPVATAGHGLHIAMVTRLAKMMSDAHV